MKVWFQDFLTSRIIKGFSRCLLIVFNNVRKRVKCLCPQHNKDKIISYHCHHPNQTGKSWGTVLQSCCLYYFLQNRSLLQRHQPLYLHWQQKQSTMVLYMYEHLPIYTTEPSKCCPQVVFYYFCQNKIISSRQRNWPIGHEGSWWRYPDFWSVWSPKSLLSS